MSLPISKPLDVLVVDDDPAMLRIVSSWLEREGYVVRRAPSGREALAAIEQRCPNILVTDWEMPEMNGLELCHRVRALNLPHYVFIIFLTVKSATEERIAALEVGADDFVSKPVNQGELLARIRAGTRILELERRLRRMARTDSLTGLLTRGAFYDEFRKEWDRSQRYGGPIACVMMDLDFFKRINDSHGHAAGDAALKALATILEKTSRASDVVCRYGGEEFCVLFPETNELGAAQWVALLQRRLRELRIPTGKTDIQVTASFGVAQKTPELDCFERLIDLADQALLCAKQSGRDRLVRFSLISEAKAVRQDDSDRLADLFRDVTARHVMTPVVVCLHESQSVGQAMEFFLRSRINSAPVVDADSRLAGILSEKDLMVAMASLDHGRTPLSEVMKPRVICFEEDTPIQELYELLCRVSIHRVVIVKQNYPVGVVSQATLLRWFHNLMISRELADGLPARPQASAEDAQTARRHLAEASRALAQQASQLERLLGEDVEDVVPYVVGGATRMQELINDLLAYSPYGNREFGGGSPTPSTFYGGGRTD